MNFWQQLVEPLRTFWEQLKIFLPHLVLSLAIVVIGLLVAWLAREVVHRVLRAAHFDTLASRMGLSTAMERVSSFRSPSAVAAQAVQWLIIIIALLIGLDSLDTSVTRGLVARFMGYLPQLLVAAFILLIGSIVSRFLARGVLLAAVNAGMRGAGLAAGLVRFLVMALATVAALEHLGIGRSTVLLAFAIVFGGVVMALSIAFGLGGRDLARSLLEGQLRKRGSDETEEEGVHHL